jgi:FixJ family two-component response regulator
MSEKATVHVIDDDTSICASLSRLLRSIDIEARTYGSVLEFCDSHVLDGPGCIIIDVRLPGISGLEFQSRRRELGVCLPIVLMTGHGDIPMSVRAMKDGAVDFLSKPFRDQDMIDAVSTAIQLDREQRAAGHDIAQVVEQFSTLTGREQQVMTLVATGMMNKQVAGELGLSEITVKVHRGIAMKKMGARSFAALVRMSDIIKLHNSPKSR